MNPNLIITRMEEIGDDLRSTLTKWNRLYDALEKMRTENPSLKDNHGKLTEAGRQRMSDMLADGSTNAEIAMLFEISPSAVSYHRQKHK